MQLRVRTVDLIEVKIMKIALFQMNIVWEDKQKNYSEGERAICHASHQGVELILFPEMSFTGFSMNIAETQEKDGQTVRFICQMAQTYQIAIGFGWVKYCGEKAENHYTIVDEKGIVLSDYVKIHPFSYAGETKYFNSGKDIYCFSWKNHTWCSFICYDLRFPEIFQYASECADVIIVPANWPKKREDHWRTLLKARAIENQSYILGINCVGRIGEVDYSGCTSAYSPDGNLIEEMYGKSGFIYVDLEDKASDERDKFPVKADRKWKFYKELYKKHGVRYQESNSE